MSTPEWTVLEKLLLSQAVYKYGEDNWFQIARNLKHHALLDRPSDYFNQKSCSIQYYLMVESLDREKQNPLTQDMPAVVQIARELYTLRLDELKKAINEDEEKFLQLVTEIDEIRAGKWDDQLLGLPKDQISAADITTENTNVQKSPVPSPSASIPVIDDPLSEDTIVKEEMAKVNMDNLEDELRMENRDEDMQADESKDDIPKPSSEESVQPEQNETHPQLDESIDTQPEVQPVATDEQQPPDEDQPEEAPEQPAEIQQEEEQLPEKHTEDIPAVDIQPVQNVTEEEEPSETQLPAAVIEDDDIQGPHQMPSDIETSAPAESDEMIIKRSHKRQIDDSEDMEEHDTKRQRTERMFQRRLSDTGIHPMDDGMDETPGDIDEQVSEDAEEMKRDYEDLLTIDTTRTDYSTDVSQGTTPVDTSDLNLREGTESVAGSESNAATPTAERKRGMLSRDDQRHKSWQKNINLLWREIANHKNGAMFMNPIKESIAPHYYEIVKRPMDLKTIKNRIRDGMINTTTEFERDVLLMLNNSLMYNKEGTEVYQLAREMLDDTMEQIRIFRTADTDTAASSHTRAAAKADRRKSTVPE